MNFSTEMGKIKFLGNLLRILLVLRKWKESKQATIPFKWLFVSNESCEFISLNFFPALHRNFRLLSNHAIFRQKQDVFQISTFYQSFFVVNFCLIWCFFKFRFFLEKSSNIKIYERIKNVWSTYAIFIVASFDSVLRCPKNQRIKVQKQGFSRVYHFIFNLFIFHGWLFWFVVL